MTNKTYDKIIKDCDGKIKSLSLENGWLWFYNLHQKEVINYAKKLLKIYRQADSKTVIISCWLHDIAYYSINAKRIMKVKANHHIDGALIAEKFLKDYDIDQEEIDKIKSCILCHRNHKPFFPKTIEEKVVAAADTMSHFGSIFYFTYFKFHPEHTIEQMVADNLNKLRRDYQDLKLLPEARKLVKEEFGMIKKLHDNYKI